MNEPETGFAHPVFNYALKLVEVSGVYGLGPTGGIAVEELCAVELARGSDKSAIFHCRIARDSITQVAPYRSM